MVLDTEVGALKRVLRSKEHERFVTSRQIYTLVMLFNEAIPGLKKPTRIAIMDYLIGDIMWDICEVRVTSFKNITGEIASALIDQLSERIDDEIHISSYGKEVLVRVKNVVETAVVTGQTTGANRVRMEAHLPNL